MTITPLHDSSGEVTHFVAVKQDITRRKRADERLSLFSQVVENTSEFVGLGDTNSNITFANQAWLRALGYSEQDLVGQNFHFMSAEGIFVCDPQERILIVNKAFEKLTGFSADEAVSKTPRILQSGRQDRSFYADMWKSVLETGTWSGEVWNRRKNGEFYVEWLSISAVYDHKGAVTHYVGIFSDVTVRKQAEERIVHLANYDALTDLPNRVLLMDRLNQLTKAAQRRKSKVAVVFIDLDRFKEVNDSLGYDAGDLLLQTLAKRLSDAARDEDTVARLEGDEFVVVFQGLHEAREVTALAQKPLSCLALPVTLNGYELTVTASLGISLYPDDAADGLEMIRNAWCWHGR